MTPIKDILNNFPQILTIVEDGRARFIRRETLLKRGYAPQLTFADRADVDRATLAETVLEPDGTRRVERFDLETQHRLERIEHERQTAHRQGREALQTFALLVTALVLYVVMTVFDIGKP